MKSVLDYDRGRFQRLLEPKDQRIRGLANVLFERCAQGLLRRAVEGFERVLQRGTFSDPAPVQRATLAWIHHSDPVRVFVEINLLRTGNPKDRIPAGEMFNQCCNFCDASQLPLPASMREVKDALEQLGFTSTKSSNMYWIGVRFLEDG